MSETAQELIGYLFMLGVILLVLRLTCTPSPKRGKVIPIRKDDDQ